MLSSLIQFSLKNRLLVLVGSLVLAAYGGYRATQIPIDVFPDLNRPMVTVMTESHGLAPEEVETLVTFPIEAAMNGASGVRRVRSASGIGLSIVWAEFDWGTDIYVARQIVAEKLQLVRARLPTDLNPVMAPITSIMGEVLLIGLTSNGATNAMELRTLADWVVRPRLLAQAGVAQVTVLGGELKQYQVLTSPERLARYGVTLDELTRAVSRSNAATGGGFLQEKDRESLIRIVGRATSLGDLAETVVRTGDPVPITVRQVAEVRLGGPVKRGQGSVGGKPAVILSVQKQPGADTLDLTRRIDHTLGEIRATVPTGVTLDTEIFRQQRFIDTAIANVLEAIRDGAFWVVVVLFLFLWNLRVSLITLAAIPLSIVVTALVFDYFGVTINTMTLGGLAVAIGELVDDSIVDVENIYRRLKENAQKERPDPPLEVVFHASAEVRNSIVYATLIVVLVVTPLFSLPGLEGRMFAPLGVSYLLTLLASLLVSLTVTPALASLLLPRARFLARHGDPLLLRGLKRLDEQLLRFTLRHTTAILLSVALLVVVSAASIGWMGGEFLPEFNEGTLTLAATCPPGTNLAESDRLGTRIEQMLLKIPEVTHVARRTGRAELDEHAENVNFSEIDVGLVEPERPRPGVINAVARALPGLRDHGIERVGRPRAVVLAEIRDTLSEMPGVVFNIGQPISHRLDHIMSGIRAQVVVKLFGPDLIVLRDKADEIALLMAAVPGVVDLQVEPQVDIPQVQVRIRREVAARHGLAPGDVAEALETAFQGRAVSQVLEGQRTFDLVVWFDERARHDVEVVRSTLIGTPSGAKVALGSVAEVLQTVGPNTINRENVVRRIVVQANTAGRDLTSVVEEIQATVARSVVPTLPPGFFVEYGGQFEAQRAANRRLLILSGLSILGIFLLLYKCLDSWRAALQVLVNVPLAAIGSVIALFLVHWPGGQAFQGAPWWQWPRIWGGSVTLSVAHWVGFITLIGIVCRNGIMMISHYIHLMRHEGETFGEAMIIRGSLERLAPVLMTALTAAIGLVPLALGEGQTGKEILHPLAIVVIGGLISSTLLDQVVTPALFFRFGRGADREGKTGPG
ncbi:efflux RND transporter permease subunit [Singulisphaera sp. Ch08]|uniref:Efflux RND transporter permease subunit n=1 Tax=Singulisphaera sp. Ch08 TaxID=3120278 RepID=A0AAU7CGY8_9BACT